MSDSVNYDFGNDFGYAPDPGFDFNNNFDWSQLFSPYTGTSDILSGAFGSQPYSPPFDISQLANPSASIASADPSWWGNMTNSLGNMTGQQLTQLGLGVGSLGLGLGSGLASIFGNGPGIGGTSGNSNTQAQLSPAQQAALQSAVSQLQAINNIGMTGPTGVANVIGGMVNPSQQAYGQGLGLLESLAPQYLSGTSPLQQQQNAILNPLSAYTANMLNGNMTIPPGLQSLVSQAFQGQADDIMHQAVIGARNQGFAGGAELLNRAPAAGIAGPLFSKLAGQEAGYLLDSMLKTIPQSAIGAAGAYNQPIQGIGTFAQQFASPLITAGETNVNRQLDFLKSATTPAAALGSIGTSNPLATGGTVSQQSQSGNPSTFNQFNSLLGSLGQSLNTLGNLFPAGA